MRVSGKRAMHGLTHARRASGHRAALQAVAFRSILPLVIVSLGVSGVARADDFWKHKPPEQWTAAEALKLVRRSPWAKQEVVVFLRQENQADYSIPTGLKHCDPDAIDANGNCTQKGRIEVPVESSRGANAGPRLSPSTAFLVRWESATTVTQAFARLEELGERAAAEFQAPAPRVPMERYVITVKLEQAGRAGFEPFAVTTAGKSDLRATLKTHRGTVAPLDVEFTGTGSSASVHFFFPRTLDGAPLLGPERDSAELTLSGVSFSVRSKFTLDPEFLH
jgi:hypothetical protein